ncbi:MULTISPECIES: hypothetical protein [unclassified Paenibacillus]|uniref:hypothetical protein n=1 Tax=unclassified Paenibacillus TaxID=185978 RepID=UPI00362898CE
MRLNNNWKSGSHKIMYVAITGALISVTGCSSDLNKPGETKDSSKPAVDQVAQAKFTYTLPGKFVNWMKDMNHIPVLLKETGANIEFINGGDGDPYYKNIDLKVGSGDFSDAGIMQLSQAEVYGSKGAFVDLRPLIDQYGPNIKKFLDAHPDYAKLVTSSNGKMYAIIPQYPKISNTTFYRDDMFKKAGITTDPKTIQEFTEVLRKLKDTYKDNKNFYPFGGREDFVKFQSAFSANDLIDGQGKVHGVYNGGQGYDLKAAGFKKMIDWYIEIYKDKLIDPEWVSGLSTEEAWQTKVLNGNVAIGHDFYTRPSWFLINGGAKTDPNFSMKVMPPFLNDAGGQSKFPTVPEYRVDRAFVINAKSADKAPSIIKFLDYLYSDKGQTLVGWGVEGTTFKKNPNGKNEFTIKFEEESTKPLGTPAWTFFQDRLTFPIPVNNEAFYEFNHSLTKSYANDYFNKYAETFPIIKYSTDELKERSNLVAKVNEALKANLVKFVTGKRPVAEWDAFLKEMDTLGYSKIVEIDQKAYDTMIKK